MSEIIVNLDFTQPRIEQDPHYLILDFGSIEAFNVVDAVVDLRVIAEIVGRYKPPIGNNNIVDAVVDLRCLASLVGVFDINFELGLSLSTSASYQSPIAVHHVLDVGFNKSKILLTHHEIKFDTADTLTQRLTVSFEPSQTVLELKNVTYNNAQIISNGAVTAWDVTQIRSTQHRLDFDTALGVAQTIDATWLEKHSLHQRTDLAYQVADQVLIERVSVWGLSLEFAHNTHVLWDQAMPVHYRKHGVISQPQRPKPLYAGSPNLDFQCLCDFDAHNLILNFGDDDCLPQLNKEWWYILNEIELTRLDTGQQILAFDGNYSASRSQWAWNYSLNVPDSEIEKLESDNPVVLKLLVNGNEHHILLDAERTRTRSFGELSWSITGRSLTASLDDVNFKRSYLQENEYTSIQLCQSELDRVYSDTVLDWQLISELGWVVPNQALSYTNSTPIEAIKLIAEAGGGFVYSSKAGNTLSIKPKYKKAYWEAMTTADYDVILPESVVTKQTTEYKELPEYNYIELSNSLSGNTAQVKRRGTAGDVKFDPVSNALFESTAMASYAKSALARVGEIEDHRFTLPMPAEIGEPLPGDTVVFGGQWWGVIDEISVSFNHVEVNQTLKVERIVHE